MIGHTRARAYEGDRGNPPPPSTPATLEALADRLIRLCPSHRDPERFWVQKSELADELRRLAREIGRAA